jgi:archaellin
MGIGTMLIFIAMALVAAVAAGVLLSTGYLVQQQAQTTGHKAIADVATTFWIHEVYGDRGTTYSDYIRDIYIKIALEAGSPDVNLSEVIIQVSDSITAVELKYGTTATATTYSATALCDPEGVFSAQNPRVTQGTLIKVTIAAYTAGLRIGTQDDVWIRVIPKHGTSTYESFTTPEAFIDRCIELI